ncbi:MAG: DinB family protein, partial [Roseiflexaceae bacterium]
MQTQAERAESLALMRTAAAELSSAVAGLSAEQLTTRYIATEWTVAQNVHHMADSHAFALNNVLI